MKILPVEDEFFSADRRTDEHRQTDRRTGMMKLMVAFRNFENAPKKTQTLRTTTRQLVPVLN
jgi:hypothetical protein